MAFTQLSPSIPLHVLGKGAGHAIAVIDYGPEHHLIWVTAITATGEIWCAPNPQVRMEANWTLGRPRSPVLGDADPVDGRAAVPPSGGSEAAGCGPG